MALSEVLKERGYVYQHSSKTLPEITGKKRTLYLGIDPSADSLQIGQLMAFLILRRFIEDGHNVILLIGGGTGMIGDPGGKNTERPLLDIATIERNGAAIAEQARRLFGGADFTLMNNADWLRGLDLIEFLRDVGKHFTVNTMIQREFIKERIKNPDEGISYTEFTYALLQAYDFYHLHTNYGADLQVGGSDQWGNIISGVDFIRRKGGDEVFALTWPLLVDKKTGKKFGKSEAGTIWLSAEKTSPFQFYQFLLNTDDEMLDEYLLKLTLLQKTEIQMALELHKRNPKERHGQQLLAREVTALVHGDEEADKAEAVSKVLFGEAALSSLTEEGREMLKESAPTCTIESGMPIIDALVAASLASSKREARQFLEDGAVSLNDDSIADPKRTLDPSDFSEGLALLGRGKHNVCVLILAT